MAVSDLSQQVTYSFFSLSLLSTLFLVDSVAALGLDLDWIHLGFRLAHPVSLVPWLVCIIEEEKGRKTNDSMR